MDRVNILVFRTCTKRKHKAREDGSAGARPLNRLEGAIASWYVPNMILTLLTKLGSIALWDVV